MRPDSSVVYGVVAIIWLFLAPVLVTKVQRSIGIDAAKDASANIAREEIKHVLRCKEKDLEAGVVHNELDKDRKQ